MNKVFQIGRLVRDSELKYLPNETAVCNFTIAVDRTFKNAKGEKEADFFTVIAYKQLAELCSKYLDKGKLCAVDGRLQTRNYMHKDGYKVYVTEIIANEVQFLSPKDEQQNNNNSTAGEFDPNSEIPF